MVQIYASMLLRPLNFGYHNFIIFAQSVIISLIIDYINFKFNAKKWEKFGNLKLMVELTEGKFGSMKCLLNKFCVKLDYFWVFWVLKTFFSLLKVPQSEKG